MGRVKHAEGRNPVNVHIGGRLRTRRLMLGLSQTQLAQLVGITFQQIQKYEKGSNAMSPARLLEMANALGVHFTYFFEGLDSKPEKAAAERAQPELSRWETRVLSLLGIMPPHQRRPFIRLAAALARATGDPTVSSVAAELEDDDPAEAEPDEPKHHRRGRSSNRSGARNDVG